VVKCLYAGKVTWLDVDCGTGKMAELDSELADRLVLCDNSSDMLDIAKKQVVSENTKCVLKSVQETEYENEFEVVAEIQVFHYLTARECKRQLANALTP